LAEFRVAGYHVFKPILVEVDDGQIGNPGLGVASRVPNGIFFKKSILGPSKGLCENAAVS